MVKTQSSGLVDVEINATWQHFLRQRVNSFIKWDLVRFFHDNPNTIDTAENIAHVVGRDVKTIYRELEGLVQSEVLVKESLDGHPIYRLSADDQIRQLIREFVAACHNREFRIKAINQVIHGMGYTPRHDF
jgi:hypothetical protein